MTSNNRPLHNVSSVYGAPMGRRSFHDKAVEGLRFHLSQVRLDSGGYDSGGAYWGAGGTLYQASAGSDVVFYLRAKTRDLAKAEVLKDYPTARFFR